MCQRKEIQFFFIFIYFAGSLDSGKQHGSGVNANGGVSSSIDKLTEAIERNQCKSRSLKSLVVPSKN
jgi:hypothetical protein